MKRRKEKFDLGPGYVDFFFDRRFPPPTSPPPPGGEEVANRRTWGVPGIWGWGLLARFALGSCRPGLPMAPSGTSAPSPLTRGAPPARLAFSRLRGQPTRHLNLVHTGGVERAAVKHNTLLLCFCPTCNDLG